jgi:hypothetical protein
MAVAIVTEYIMHSFRIDLTTLRDSFIPARIRAFRWVKLDISSGRAEGHAPDTDGIGSSKVVDHSSTITYASMPDEGKDPGNRWQRTPNYAIRVQIFGFIHR